MIEAVLAASLSGSGLGVSAGQSSLVAAFVAGVASAFSPCVLPIAPAVLAGSVGHRLRPLVIVAGMTVTFTLMGGLLSALGVATGASGDVLRLVFIATIFLFGLVMVSPEVKMYFSSLSSRFTGRARVEGDGSLVGGFVLGLSLGIVWIPCVGPVLGSILALAAYQDTVMQGTLLLAVYSIGLALPLLALVYGGKTVASRLEVFKRRGSLLEKAAGWVLIATAVAMLLGLDRWVQQVLL